MSVYVLFLIVGLGLGALYAALALGLVLVYKGTGVVNFAQGAMAMWAAFVYDEVRKSGDLIFIVGRVHVGTSTALAVVLGILSSGAIGGICHLLVFRPLRRAPVLAKVVASLGLLVTLQALVSVRFGATPRRVRPVLPTDKVHFGGLTFSIDRIYLTGLVVALAAAVWAVLRFTRWGTAMRAAAENERSAEVLGYSPQALAAASWVASAALTGAIAILASQSATLDSMSYALYVVPALAAALLGQLSSVGIAVAAGLAFGAVQSEFTYIITKSWWPDWAASGINDVLPLVVVIVALFILGKNLPTRAEATAPKLPPVFVPRWRPVHATIAVVAVVVALVATGDTYRFGIITSMIMTIISLSLVLLTGFAGQVSLAQAAFAGTGGFVLSRLASDAHVPFPFSMILGACAASAVGVIIAIPALRVRGSQLAVVTLAAAVAVERFIFGNPGITPLLGNPVPHAHLPGIDLAVRRKGDLVRLPFAIFVLIVLLAVIALVINLTRGSAGRAMLAVRSNERAAAAAGINVTATKVLVFAVSSFLAGLAGCLLGYSRGQVSVGSFTALVGVALLAYAYLGGITSVVGAAIAGSLAPLGIGYVVLSDLLGENMNRYYLLISGLGLVVTSVLNPIGIAGQIAVTKQRLMNRTRRVTTGQAASSRVVRATLAKKAT
jgi:branched-chain amino acid transport system permease protein